MSTPDDSAPLSPPQHDPVASGSRPRLLPMLARYPVIAGALAGLLLRFAFSGDAGSSWSAMAGWFIYGAPFVVGMVTVYLAERERRRSWGYYLGAPAVATGLFVIGSLVVLIEGLICAVVIVPMFAALGALGGLVMGLVCRLTRWPRHTLQCVAVLPILFAASGASIDAEPRVGSITRSTRIDAPIDVVWQQLHDIRDISEAEMSGALAADIGVPMPRAGRTTLGPEGRVRRSSWGKQVYFDEIITDWQPPHLVRWTYRFSQDSFPRGALDDHVVIGGHYFDLIDTSYRLQQEGDSVRLTTTVTYRISTQFNFYADWVAQLLLGNLSEVGLDLYRARSEAQGRTAMSTSDPSATQALR